MYCLKLMFFLSKTRNVIDWAKEFRICMLKMQLQNAKLTKWKAKKRLKEQIKV
jgi:hypothetical protein